MTKAKSNTAIAETETASNVTSISAAARSNRKQPPVAKPSDDLARLAPEATLVVFGRDDGGKAHASWFSAVDAELATKAAGLMGYLVLPITSEEHRVAAAGLVAGRVFSSGKGFVPFCKDAVHAALQAFPEAYQPEAPAEPEAAPPPIATNTPQTWEAFGVGSLVLASVGPDEGWFEAIITESRGDSIFVLRWQGWPEHDAFVRRADGLGLLPARPTEALASSK